MNVVSSTHSEHSGVRTVNRVATYDNYQLLHQYHKILAACNIQGE